MREMVVQSAEVLENNDWGYTCINGMNMYR